jgi:hypothetical protein
VTVSVVEDVTEIFVPAVPPKLTVVDPLTKFVPVTVILTPPDVVAVPGVTFVTDGSCGGVTNV